MRTALLFVACLQLFFARSQDASQALAAYNKSCPQEKVVLVFSKPQYVAGENSFFKAYVLQGYEPSELSATLYVELLDKEKNLLDKQLVPLFRGSGEGSFALPANLAEDVYYVRAYTHWMLNFNEAFQCVKPLRIYNPYSSQKLCPKPVRWTARAFAEGDSLVDGVVTTIAVRLYADGSLPDSWSGKLVETETQEFVADVSVYNNEIGRVQFVPEAGKRFSLRLKDNAGNEKEILLPTVVTSGVALRITSSADKLNYVLVFKNIPNAGKGFKLVATFNNEPAFAATITRSTGEISGNFDVKDSPAGVLQFNLFTEQGMPLAERLCFIHPHAVSASSPTLQLDTFSIGAKGYNHWHVATDSTYSNSFTAEVSDAAFPVSSGFLPSVYFTSDFPSASHDPAWYFTELTEKKVAALDALLLTEKWNRFHWNDVLQHRFPSLRFAPERYLDFRGTVSKGKKPVAQRELNLLMQGADGTVGFLQVMTDNEGHFPLKNYYFLDSAKILLQPSKRKFLERDLTFAIESLNNFYPYKGTLPADEWTTATRSKKDTLPLWVQRTEAQRRFMQLQDEKEMLEPVIVKTNAKTRTQILDEQLSSSLFFTGEDVKIFDFVNNDYSSLASATNILTWLQSRLPGYAFYGSGMSYRGRGVSLFVDEVPSDFNAVSFINPADVAMVKVFRGNIFAGPSLGDPSIGFTNSYQNSEVVAIYLRRGNLQQQGPALPMIKIAGYPNLPKPASPNYANHANSAIQDERTVLYYNAALPPDTTKRMAQIQFYNNDVTKQFRFVLTGFSNDGRPVFVNRILPDN